MNLNSLELILEGHENRLEELLKNTSKELIIVSPWIKQSAANLVIKSVNNDHVKLKIYTRFNLNDLVKGISDLKALSILLNYFQKSEIRFIPNLHAKIYISDNKKALITSGNLTRGGLSSNVEAGILLNEDKLVFDLTNNISSLMDSALCLEKSTFSELITKIEPDILSKSKIKYDNKEKSEPQNNLSLGKAIRPSKTPDTLGKINNALNIKIDLVTESEASSERQPWICGEHGKSIQAKITKNYPELSTIKPELIEAAFLHSTFNNIFSVEKNSISQSRLAIFGSSIINTLFYIYFFNKYGDKYSPGLVRLLKMYHCDDFIMQSELFKVFDYKEDLLSFSTFSTSENKVPTKIIEETNKAFIAVIYLSLGFDKTYEFLNKFLKSQDPLISLYLNYDTKSTLMEVSQMFFNITPTYSVISENGTDNDKIFKVAANLKDKQIALGAGTSKKNAEMNAAKNSLKEPLISPYIQKWYIEKIRNVSLKKQNSYALSPDRKNQLKELEVTLGLKKLDINLLNRCLTHGTWCNDHHIHTDNSYTALVTPGSSIWDMLLASLIFYNPQIAEDETQIVREKFYALLPSLFNKLKLFRYMSVGNTMKNNISDTIKNEAAQALLYVIYRSNGYRYTLEYITNLLKEDTNTILKSIDLKNKDPKGQLQDLLQRAGKTMENIFSIIAINGPRHNQEYTVGAYLNNQELGIGRGKSIKEAEQHAAKEAILSIIMQYNKLFP